MQFSATPPTGRLNSFVACERGGSTPAGHRKAPLRCRAPGVRRPEADARARDKVPRRTQIAVHSTWNAPDRSKKCRNLRTVPPTRAPGQDLCEDNGAQSLPMSIGPQRDFRPAKSSASARIRTSFLDCSKQWVTVPRIEHARAGIREVQVGSVRVSSNKRPERPTTNLESHPLFELIARCRAFDGNAVGLNRLHGPPERSNRLLRCEIQEGVRPYIRAGVAVILLPMMAIRGRGSYLRDVLKVQAIHRISPGPA